MIAQEETRPIPVQRAFQIMLSGILNAAPGGGAAPHLLRAQIASRRPSASMVFIAQKKRLQTVRNAQIFQGVVMLQRTVARRLRPRPPRAARARPRRAAARNRPGSRRAGSCGR